MSQNVKEVSSHLSKTLSAHGILRNMVSDTRAEDQTLVVTWARVRFGKFEGSHNDLSIVFQNAAAASLAQNLLKNGIPDAAPEIPEAKRRHGLPSLTFDVAG